MKKNKYFLFLFLVLVCTSCNFFYSVVDDLEHITSKTTIKTFTHLNEPIVLTMPVYKTKSILGIKNWAESREKIGDIFVVIDWETESVYDWVYFPGEGGMTNWNAKEVIGNPINYYVACPTTAKIAWLDPSLTEVQKVQTSCKEYLYFFSSNNKYKSNYLLSDSNYYDSNKNKRIYCVNIFDTSKNQDYSEKIDLNYDSKSYMSFFAPMSDDNGNMYFTYPNDGSFELAKINCEKLELEVLKIYENTILNPDYKEKDESPIYNKRHIVEYAGKDYVIIYEGAPNTDFERYWKIHILDVKNNYEEKVFDLDLIKAEFVTNILKVDEKFYAFIYEAQDEDKYSYFGVLEIDPEEGTYKRLTERKYMAFTYVNDVYVRGDDRVYLINNWDPENIWIAYFDVNTKTLSEPKYITIEDVVSKR